MYKVIVVDDKPMIRKALVCTIPWEKLQCQVVGEAENGVDAKCLIDQTEPDLLISDIKMPGMDGLALTEYVKKKGMDTQVIIITGYQEFEYAQKALSLGVSDLILKPLRNDIMEEKIRKALSNLNKERMLNHAVDHSRKARQEQFLSEIFKGRMNSEAFTGEKLRELDFYKKNYFLILARVRTGDEEVEKETRCAIMAWMEKKKTTMDWMIFEWISGKNQTVVVFEKEKRSARARKIGLKQCLVLLNEEIQKKQGVSVCFAVSRTSNDLDNLADSYRETEQIMEYDYFMAEHDILFADHVTTASLPESVYLLKELDQFYQVLEQMEEQELREKVHYIMQRVVGETNGDEFRVKCLLSEIGIALLHHYGKEVKAANELMTQIGQLTDKYDCEEFLFRFLVQIRQEGRQKGNPLIASALDYLYQHYRENLSLTELAEKLAVNPSYLSRLFKKETGKNFLEILTEYRIRKAKYLLEQPGSRVIEVCEQVGYSDYTYFYQVFKRLENMSPSEYKKRSKNI